MRVHGKKFAKKYVDTRVERKTETRDAVVWSVDTINYVVRVKIQGSNEFIYAHYPRNWKKTPYWLKRGNAVSIRHRQGVRGYTEVIGEGRAIPTPISGEAFPPSDCLPDGIISGMYVSETYPLSLAANISNGWYRINCTEYYFTPDQIGFMVMDDPPPALMGSEDPMGLGNYTVAFGDPVDASGEWRYDIIVIDEYQDVEVISGEQSSNPQVPSIPSDHIQIGDPILWDWNDTVFTLDMMGEVWTAPVISSFSSTVESTSQGEITDGFRFVWRNSGESGYPTPYVKITVNILDQYGMDLNAGAGGYDIRCERHEEIGTGLLYSDDDGWMNAPPYYVIDNVSSGSEATFYYKRDQTAYEEQPIIVAKYEKDHSIKTGIEIQLMDSSGVPVSGEW